MQLLLGSCSSGPDANTLLCTRERSLNASVKQSGKKADVKKQLMHELQLLQEIKGQLLEEDGTIKQPRPHKETLLYLSILILGLVDTDFVQALDLRNMLIDLKMAHKVVTHDLVKERFLSFFPTFVQAQGDGSCWIWSFLGGCSLGLEYPAKRRRTPTDYDLALAHLCLDLLNKNVHLMLTPPGDETSKMMQRNCAENLMAVEISDLSMAKEGTWNPVAVWNLFARILNRDIVVLDSTALERDSSGLVDFSSYPSRTSKTWAKRQKLNAQTADSHNSQHRIWWHKAAPGETDGNSYSLVEICQLLARSVDVIVIRHVTGCHYDFFLPITEATTFLDRLASKYDQVALHRPVWTTEIQNQARTLSSNRDDLTAVRHRQTQAAALAQAQIEKNQHFLPYNSTFRHELESSNAKLAAEVAKFMNFDPSRVSFLVRHVSVSLALTFLCVTHAGSLLASARRGRGPRGGGGECGCFKHGGQQAQKHDEQAIEDHMP